LIRLDLAIAAFDILALLGLVSILSTTQLYGSYVVDNKGLMKG